MAYGHHRFPWAAYRVSLPAVFAVLLLALALLRSTPALAAGVVGSGTPESCTEAALDVALAGGGIVTFKCGAEPVTITITSTKTITADTTVDGEGLITLSGGHSVGVFLANGGVTFTVQNLTIANGSANHGGGIYNEGVATLTNCTISGNTAFYAVGGIYYGDGGGIYNGGTLTLTNCTITGNSAQYEGGGISNFGPATLTNCTISGNSTERGSGIYNRGTLNLTNCTLSNNSGRGDGGGIYNEGTAPLTNCTLSSNSAAGSGGGIYNGGGTATLTNCTLSGNSVGGHGGGIAIEYGPATLTNCTISGNSAAGYGGGINNFVPATLTNCTITGNSAFYAGGGIAIEGASTLTNCTLSGNSAAEGGGIKNDGSAGLRNTLIANSPSGGDCVTTPVGAIIDNSHNLIGDAANACGLTNGVNGNLVGVDPRLGPLANNGGPTQTQALCTHAAVPDVSCTGHSPAIDAVPLAACVDAEENPLTSDQRGVVRPQGATCDIGAFELVAVTATPTASQTPTPSVTATAIGGGGGGGCSMATPPEDHRVIACLVVLALFFARPDTTPGSRQN